MCWKGDWKGLNSAILTLSLCQSITAWILPGIQLFLLLILWQDIPTTAEKGEFEILLHVSIARTSKDGRHGRGRATWGTANMRMSHWNPGIQAEISFICNSPRTKSLKCQQTHSTVHQHWRCSHPGEWLQFSYKDRSYNHWISQVRREPWIIKSN